MRLARLKGWLRRLLLERLRLPFVYAALVRMESALFGRKVRVETCSKCQLKCPTCATARGETRHGAVGWGSLSPEDFSRFLERSGRLREIELSNWGEIFLNRRLPEILALAAQAGIPVTAANGVNLNHASDAALEALVVHRVRAITVSIDGASRESYAQFRRHGDFDRVLHHIERINHFKRLHGSALPVLTWQFIVFAHNEHELDAARALAAAHDMRFDAIRNLAVDFSPLPDPRGTGRRAGIDLDADTDVVLDVLGDTLGFCQQVWDAPQVNWNGELLGCCFNNGRGFGNAFDVPLPQLLQGDDYRYLQQMLTGRKPLREDMPCARCRLFPRRHLAHG